MPGLVRTDLATPRTIELAAAAVTRQGEQGAISQLSRAHGVCWRTVVRARELGACALAERFAEAPEAPTVVVGTAQLERAGVALRMTGRCTVRGIVDLVPVLYAGMTTSYGAVGGGLGMGFAAPLRRRDPLTAVPAGCEASHGAE